HRRRLEESGLRFRDLVKQSRLGQAEAMLQRGQSVGQVSEALAYSDIRAFNRAFKQWKGVTPAVFLKSLRGAKDTGDA
ncbi:MAG: helix-turn-helix domain-containing protein, partial [Pseudomonadota bacterium]